MIIGTMFHGRMKSLNDQWIETKYLIIGIPLIPLSSMFVTKSEGNSRQGFEIGMHGQSVLKGYLSILSAIAGVGLTFIGPQWAGIPLLAAAIYFYFFFGKSSEAENQERTLFQLATGINALPAYLNVETAITLRNRVILALKQQLNQPEMDWLAYIESESYDETTLSLVFAAIGYQTRIEKGNARFNALYEKLKAEFTLITAARVQSLAKEKSQELQPA